MPSYDYRILIDTVNGKKYSYTSASFFNTDVDTSYTASAFDVFNRITHSLSCSYFNYHTSSVAIPTKAGERFDDQPYLSASLQGNPYSGSIQFIYKGLQADGTQAIGMNQKQVVKYDRLKRYKFFGSKVCDVLDIQENHWYTPESFILNHTTSSNVFRGNVQATSLNVDGDMRLSNTAGITSNIPIKIDKKSSKFMIFRNVSGSAEIPNDDLIIGYNDETDTYMISASSRTGDTTKFVIDGVTSMNVTSLTSSYTTSSVRQIFTEITSSGNSIFGDANTDNHRFLGNVSILGKGQSAVSHSVDGLTVAGQISSSGNIKTDGTITATALGISTDLNMNNANIYMSDGNIQWVGQGDIVTTVNEIDWDLADNIHEAISFDTTGKAGILRIDTINSDERVVMSNDLYIEGNISSSTTSTGSFANIHLQNNNNRIQFKSPNTYIYSATGDGLPSDAQESLYIGSYQHILLEPNSEINIKQGDTTYATFHGTGLNLTGNITASGDISGSKLGTISSGTGSFSRIEGTGEGNETRILFTDDDINIRVGNINFMDFTQDSLSELTINESSQNLDVRIEGEADANLFFTDASVSKVGIGTNSPDEKLEVDGNIKATGTVSASNFYLTASAASGVDVHMGIHGGDTNNPIGKWEFKRNNVRKWLIYHDGRTAGLGGQDSLVFKHGLSTDGDNHINMYMKQDDQTVYFHGPISSSTDLFVGVKDGAFVSASNGNLELSGSGTSQLIFSGSAEKVMEVVHNVSGSLFEVQATQDSGSLVLSGSLTMKDNSIIPSVSESKVYNSGSNLYFGKHAGTTPYSLGPKTLQSYHTSFYADVGTTEVCMPWASNVESAYQYSYGVAFIAPCQTNVKHVLIRTQGFDQNLPTTMTLKVKTHSPHGVEMTDEANWVTKETTTFATTNVTDTGADGGKELMYAAFSGSHAAGGDALNVCITMGADVSTGFDDWHATTVVEHDYSTLPNLGYSTGSISTGSAGFGVSG